MEKVWPEKPCNVQRRGYREGMMVERDLSEQTDMEGQLLGANVLWRKKKGGREINRRSRGGEGMQSFI